MAEEYDYACDNHSEISPPQNKRKMNTWLIFFLFFLTESDGNFFSKILLYINVHVDWLYVFGRLTWLFFLLDKSLGKKLDSDRLN